MKQKEKKNKEKMKYELREIKKENVQMKIKIIFANQDLRNSTNGFE